MHAGVMADSGKYLTAWSILGMLATAVLDRLACWRHGHDPVSCQGTVICRRCLNTLPQ